MRTQYPNERVAIWILAGVIGLGVCSAEETKMTDRKNMGGEAATVEPIDIGSSKQLFMDHRFMERQEGVTLCMNPPIKAEPVLLPETDIESHKVGGYCQIIRMQDEWWMYYNAMPMGKFEYDSSLKDGSGYMVCLATSKDGLAWKRKAVDLYNVQGGTRNNVVIPNAYGTLLVDPNETDGYRYWFLAQMEACSAWEEARGCSYHGG